MSFRVKYEILVAKDWFSELAKTYGIILIEQLDIGHSTFPLWSKEIHEIYLAKAIVFLPQLQIELLTLQYVHTLLTLIGMNIGQFIALPHEDKMLLIGEISKNIHFLPQTSQARRRRGDRHR